MKQIFEEMDTDQNGYLSLEELKVGVQEHFGPDTMAKVNYEKLLNSIDTNDDG